ncbi:ABC transporter substrate-binding protein [Halorarum halobium]|uniref:ABC transporter substrate-binding protein n=1 Tax=Halorarum halobium TaxID=3075121 RepID=UPI0028AB6527|nr:ABC transporter substrate-binding protein [Halobaculum sp. XH14]
MSKDSMPHDDQSPGQFDRRRFLQLTAGTGGTLGTAVLAGCSGDGDQSGSPDESGSGSSSADSGEKLPEYLYLNNPQDYNPARHDTINLIGEQLTELGLDVSVQVFEWGTLVTKALSEHDFDLATWGRTLADPGLRMPRFFHSDNTDPGNGNYTGYENAELDPLLEEQGQLTDAGERADVLHEIQRIVTRDCPTNPINWMPFIMAYNNSQVSGWIDHPTKFNYNSFYNMTSIEVDNEDGELRGAWPQTIGSLNVLSHQTEAQRIRTFEVLYDRLVRLDENFEPSAKLSLATDWNRPSRDVMEFTLREHEWHDGEPLTAEDVAFTLDYMAEHEVPVYKERWERVESTEVLSENEVRITFSDPPGPVHAIFSSQLPIIPKHIWETRDDPLNTAVSEPVGSGPFQVEYWDQGTELSLQSNDAHWRPPKFNRRIWQIIPESSTSWQMLREGTLNYLPFSRIGSQLDNNRSAEDISVVTMPGTGFWEVAINTRRSGLDDVAVRQAIVNSIPRTPIVEQIQYGLPEIADNLVSPAFGQYYNPDVKQFEEGVDHGRTRLEEAGYTWDDDGFVHAPSN